jgi:chromate transporter
LFARFLRFGLLAWGGPVAQIAMVRRELVDQEGWLSSSRFNRLLAVYQVLPGPEAHELCVHIGMVRGGRVGGALAGLGFMLPGLVLMLAVSWLYFRIDLTTSAIGAVFIGVQVAVIALVIRATHRIGSHVLTNRILWLVGGVAAVSAVGGVPFWLTLPAAGAVVMLAGERPTAAGLVAAAYGGLAAASLVVLGGIADEAEPLAGGLAFEPSVVGLFLSGLKAGVLTFGGAYTAIPFLRDDAVGNGWMTDGQFLDGLALSGILPAPLIIFSTFVGFVAGGFVGALAMTVGVFLPAFAFSLIFFDRLEAIVDHPPVHRFLEGVAAGVVGLIAATTLELGFALAARAPSVPAAALILCVGLAILTWWRSNLSTPAAIAVGGLAGWLLLGGAPG